MVPMSAQMRKGALHEPCSSGRESAHSSLEKFEPTHVGCYEPVLVHGPNACGKKRKEPLQESERRTPVRRRAASGKCRFGNRRSQPAVRGPKARQNSIRDFL